MTEVEATAHEDASVQVRFSTKDPTLTIESRPLLVPTSLKRYGLSEIINHLLELDPPVPFSFLIDGELLSGSVDAYLTRRGLSSESTLNVEFIRSILPPSFLASFPHDDWVSAVSLRDEEIVSGSYDSILRIWNASREVLASATGHSSGIKSIARSDNTILTSSMDRTLRLWNRNVDGISCLADLRGHKVSVESCDMVDQSIISGSADGVLGVWDASEDLSAPYTSERQNRRKRVKGSGIGVLKPKHLTRIHNGQIGQVCFNPNDISTVYSVGWDASLITTDLTTLLPLSTIKTSSALFSVCPLKEMNAVLSGGQRSIQLHDLRSESLTRSTLTGHTSIVSSLTRAPDQEYLFASGSYDGTVRVWDIRNEKSLYSISRNNAPKSTVPGDASKVLAVAWSKMGIVSGGEDCQLQINRGVDRSDGKEAKI